MSLEQENVTALLNLAQKGDGQSHAAFVDLLYAELRKIARKYMRSERSDHTLQPTALVNEAYLELFSGDERNWNNRTHFFAYAAQVMRHVLVHHAREKRAQKRGGDLLRVTFEKADRGDEADAEMLALDDALNDMEELSSRKSQIVEMKYFGGLTVEEISQVMDLSPATIHKELKAAKGWLFRKIAKGRG